MTEPMLPNDILQSIVLAEDDCDDQEIFSEALRQSAPSLKLISVKNGNELLSLLHDFLPDLLFLDLDMPGLSGLECLKRIRADERISELPIIIFSSTTRAANIAAAYELGADLFFIKPSSFREATASLSRILALHWNDRRAVKARYSGDRGPVAFS